jgi:RHS repeat-associated protein
MQAGPKRVPGEQTHTPVQPEGILMKRTSGALAAATAVLLVPTVTLPDAAVGALAGAAASSCTTAAPAAPATGAIRVSSPAGPVTVDAARYALEGTAPARSTVYVWKDANGNGTRDRREKPAGSVQLGKKKTWTVSVKLKQNAVNRFVITKVLPWRRGRAVVVPPITERRDATAPNAPTGLTAVDVAGDAGGAVTLSWTPSASTDVATQCVLRATGNGAYQLVTTLGAGVSTYTDTGLTNGTTYAYVIQAVDTVGNVGDRSLPATALPLDDQDRTAPETTITAGPAAETDLGTATFAFESSEAASTFECSQGDAEWSACVSPLELSGLAPGAHRLRVRATDPAGNTDASPASYEWTVTEAPNGLPPDPSTVASDIDPSVPTTVSDSTAFLYQGPDPIQEGVADGAIDAQRAGVVRGRVLDGEGEPLAGVSVSIKDHPDLGHTLTREDGGYDLVVNGGGELVLGFEADGHAPAQREVAPGWNDYVVLDDLVLVAYDAKVTEIDFTEPVQIAQGSPVTDESGTRQATLLFDQGTQAEMVLPDGSTQALDEVHVRATEFTVGDRGPEAMPGELPARSGYTYAAEYSIDEAVAADATNVTFSKPVVNYTDNFLGFPVGTPVPTGYYDREKAAWVPSADGRVVKVLTIDDGKAVLDVEGKGVAATPAALSALGIDDTERETLAGLYTAGESLWRVSMSHFTPWDHNWPFEPPASAEAPRLPELVEDAEFMCKNTLSGSIIGCDDLTLGERLAVAGTDRELAYQSERVPGRANRVVRVPITGATPPPGVKSAEMVVEVAGQRSVASWNDPGPNVVTNASWNGKDAYGREVQGSQLMTIWVGYTYNGVYKTARGGGSGFGSAGVDAITGSRTREEVTLWSMQQVPVGSIDARAAGLGGWTLSGAHAYDPVARELVRGDGTRQGGDDVASVIRTFAGVGTPSGFAGDGGPATAARLASPSGVATAPDGTVYVADTINQRVRRIDPSGVITTVAGTGTQGTTGDGGPATQAQISAPNDVAVGPDGTLYIAAGYSVRAVSPDGVIRTVAGTPNTIGYGGDNIPAKGAALSYVAGVDVAADGTLYIADSRNCLIRSVAPDGLIRTVAGVAPPTADNNGRCGNQTTDGTSAVKSFLGVVGDVKALPDGSLLIADTGNNRIRRVAPDGSMRTVVGAGTGGDGADAKAARIWSPHSIAVLPEGGFLFTENGEFGSSWKLRMVGPDGSIRTLAGGSTRAYGGDGGPAARATFAGPEGVAVAPDGRIYVVDSGSDRVRLIAPALPGTSTGAVAIPSSDGAELYQFVQGRHVRTVDTITGATRATIAYDEAGGIRSITDGDGDATRVERDSAGRPTAVVAPGGQRTSLTSDAAGYLASVTAPGSEPTRLTSTPTGLLETLTEPGGGVHRFTYSPTGLLQRDEGPDGVSTTLTRTVGLAEQTVTATSTLGRTARYHTERLPGGVTRRTVTAGTGDKVVGTVAADGTRTVVEPDGTTVVRTLGPDPRFGMSAPIVTAETVTTPGGRKVVSSATASAELDDPLNPLSLRKLTRTVTLNGQTSTSVIDVPTRSVTTTSPEGRVTTAGFDASGRVVRVEPGPGVEPVERSYDEHGRLDHVKQGDREVDLGYDALHRLVSIDGGDGLTRFGYDDADRVVSVTSPDDAVTRYGHDADGNVTSVTRPGGRVHRIGYDAGDRVESDDPAGAGEWTTSYDNDGQPVTVSRPGAATTLGYDDAGQLVSGTESLGSTTFAHEGPGGATSRTTADPGGGGAAQLRSFGYDGPLLTSTAVSGPAEAAWTYAYDANLLPVDVELTSGTDTVEIPYAYDKDLAMTKAGPFSIVRDGRGAATSFGDDTGSLAYGYDGYGALDALALTVADQEVYSFALETDTAGTIAGRVDEVAGDEEAVEYDYDLLGRLTEVRRDGAVVETYDYDVDGRRTSAVRDGQSVNYDYDAADRLVKAGTVAYGYTDDGSLSTRGSDTFGYGYDGRLVTAKVGGATVSYGYDAEGRRTTRTDAGGTTQYLYGSLSTPFRLSAVRGPDGLLTTLWYDDHGRLASFERGGKRFYVATDQVGSPRVVTDAAGTVVKTVRYDAFGQVLADSAPGFEVPLGFAGGIADAATGLVRFGMRDYEPGTGRWTTRDPIGLGGGQTDLYAYVAQDPVGHLDPSGLSEDDYSEASEMSVEISDRTAWDRAKDAMSWLTEQAEKQVISRAKKMLKIGPVSIDTDNNAMSVGTSQKVQVNGTDVLEVSANCSLGISPNESEDPYENIYDDTLDWKIKLSTTIPILKKIPFFGKDLKLGEEYEGSVNANDYFGGFFQNGNLARAREAGGIDAPTGSGGGGN